MTGLNVSVIGFGGGSQYMAASEADAERMIARAIELGVNFFDTAYIYGNAQESQKRYGRYLTPTHRKNIVLVSKITVRTAEGAKRQLDQTLTNLKTDYLDILHFHELASTGDVSTIIGANGALSVYQQAKEQGIIKFIGCSGHVSGAIMLDALRRIKPDVIMCPQNAARELGFTDMVIPYAQQNNIGLLGMKVTAQNALMRNGVTAEDCVRYSLSLPVASMIVGMRSMTVVESCANIARTFKQLTPGEMQGISGKLASLHLPSCLPYKRHGYQDRCIG